MNLRTLEKYLSREQLQDMFLDYIENNKKELFDSLIKEAVDSWIYDNDKLYNLINDKVVEMAIEISEDQNYKEKMNQALKRIFKHEFSGLNVDITITIDDIFEYVESDGDLL